jgi:hypothetical protein
VIDAGQVHIDDVLPRGFIGHRGDAGVGDHDVEAAEFGDALLEGGFERRAVPDVGFPRDDASAGVLDEFHRGGHVLGGGHRIRNTGDLVAQVDRDDAGALRRQLHRVSAALAPGRAGDERDLAVEFPHDQARS